MSYCKALVVALILGLISATGVHAQVLKSTSHTGTVLANLSNSISSGDTIFPTNVFLNAVDARVASPDGAVFLIGQLSITVRWFNAANVALGSLTLPTAPSVVNSAMFATQLFYSDSFVAPLGIMNLRLSAVPGATKIGIRAVAILQNTTSNNHPATVAVTTLTQ